MISATATFTGPIDNGRMVEPATATTVDLAGGGYVQEEFFASGTACSYAPVGSAGSDGRWTVRPDGSSAYRTRIVVRRPTDPARFNGTVLVEWFNVSSGFEADPDWAYMSAEILRRGYAYAGVSAQALGVMGGQGLLGLPGGGAAIGLRRAVPVRYGSLTHPGDPYSFDILSQIGRALRDDGRTALAGLRPRHVVAVGESQSAFFLTTYICAVHRTAGAFDGFFVHSRARGAAPLDGGPVDPTGGTLRIRDDLDTPVFVLQTETDLGPMLDYSPARQRDSQWFRQWEVAGTAHGDSFLVGAVARALGCDWTINEGPAHYVVKAALHALNMWVTEGVPPATAEPLLLASSTPPRLARDAHGNALGGVRTPAVDVPVAALSGDAPPGASRMCSLFGITTPFDEATLTALYHDKAGYLAEYERSLDDAIRHGFLLTDDRAALLGHAREVEFGG
jgi:hypothetical protein